MCNGDRTIWSDALSGPQRDDVHCPGSAGGDDALLDFGMGQSVQRVQVWGEVERGDRDGEGTGGGVDRRERTGNHFYSVRDGEQQCGDSCGAQGQSRQAAQLHFGGGIFEKTSTVITWIYFPKSTQATPVALEVVKAFEQARGIDSAAQTNDSNSVLQTVAPALRAAGFAVESGKKGDQKIRVPVLFGGDGRKEESFDADAYHEQAGFVVEVEAGFRINCAQTDAPRSFAVAWHESARVCTQLLSFWPLEVKRQGNGAHGARLADGLLPPEPLDA